MLPVEPSVAWLPPETESITPLVVLELPEVPDPVIGGFVLVPVDGSTDAVLLIPVLENCIVFVDPVAVPVTVVLPAVILTH